MKEQNMLRVVIYRDIQIVNCSYKQDLNAMPRNDA